MISIDCWLFTFLSLQNHSWALSFLLLWGAIPSSTGLISYENRGSSSEINFMDLVGSQALSGRYCITLLTIPTIE